MQPVRLFTAVIGTISPLLERDPVGPANAFPGLTRRPVRINSIGRHGSFEKASDTLVTEFATTILLQVVMTSRQCVDTTTAENGEVA